MLVTQGRRLGLIGSLIAVLFLSPLSMAAQGVATPAAGMAESAAPCQDGRLRIRDLEQLDATLAEGLDRLETRSLDWQQDARLVELRLACPLLATGLVWEGTFFSETAQANFLTDTADVEPSEEAPEEVPYLDVGEISFQAVYRSLLRAGYSEDLLLAPASSVTVRLSTEQNAFGPPIAPRNVVYVHVAVEERGQIKDVWIDGTDGTIYQYEMEG